MRLCYLRTCTCHRWFRRERGRAVADLSPLAEAALRKLQQQGRVRTTDNLSRLAMVELKALSLAEDPADDSWQLTELAKMKMGSAK